MEVDVDPTTTTTHRTTRWWWATVGSGTFVVVLLAGVAVLVWYLTTRASNEDKPKKADDPSNQEDVCSTKSDCPQGQDCVWRDGHKVCERVDNGKDPEKDKECGGTQFNRKESSGAQSCYCNHRQSVPSDESAGFSPVCAVQRGSAKEAYMRAGGTESDMEIMGTRYMEWHPGHGGYWSLRAIEEHSGVDPSSAAAARLAAFKVRGALPGLTADDAFDPQTATLPVVNTDVKRDPRLRSQYCVQNPGKADMRFSRCKGTDFICVNGKCQSGTPLQCGGQQFNRRAEDGVEGCYCNSKQTVPSTEKNYSPVCAAQRDTARMAYVQAGGLESDMDSVVGSDYLEWHAGHGGYWSLRAIEEKAAANPSEAGRLAAFAAGALPGLTAHDAFDPKTGGVLPVVNTDLASDPKRRSAYCVQNPGKADVRFSKCKGSDSVCVRGVCASPPNNLQPSSASASNWTTGHSIATGVVGGVVLLIVVVFFVLWIFSRSPVGAHGGQHDTTAVDPQAGGLPTASIENESLGKIVRLQCAQLGPLSSELKLMCIPRNPWMLNVNHHEKILLRMVQNGKLKRTNAVGKSTVGSILDLIEQERNIRSETDCTQSDAIPIHDYHQHVRVCLILSTLSEFVSLTDMFVTLRAPLSYEIETIHGVARSTMEHAKNFAGIHCQDKPRKAKHSDALTSTYKNIQRCLAVLKTVLNAHETINTSQKLTDKLTMAMILVAQQYAVDSAEGFVSVFKPDHETDPDYRIIQTYVNLTPKHEIEMDAFIAFKAFPEVGDFLEQRRTGKRFVFKLWSR